MRVLERSRAAGVGDDERIVAAFLSRRGDGLEAAYRAYGSALYSLARAILRKDDDAEDCVHDALLRVWQRPDSYRRERGLLRAFLMVCIRNEALTRLRNSARRRRIEHGVAIAQPTEYEFEVKDHVETERLRRALAALAPEQRTAIQLAYGEHLSQSQIAERLSLPLGTVKSRVALGLRRLHGLMEVGEGGER